MVDRADLPNVELSARRGNLARALKGRDRVARVEKEFSQPIFTIPHRSPIDLEDVTKHMPLIGFGRPHQQKIGFEGPALTHFR